MALLSYLYLYEAYLIQSLQNLLPNSGGFFMALTKVADPAYAISIVFPVAASVNTGLAAEILVASVASEWFNTLLKWLLMEHRPYWWIKEFGARGVDIRQTPLTCETGPGSPSGHIMGSAATLYVFLRFLIDYFVVSDVNLSEKQKKCRLWSMWIVYFLLLTLVGVSRVIIGAHFPHQCLLGAFLGLGLGYVLTDTTGRYTVGRWWRNASRSKMFLVTVTMSLISVGAYLFHFLVGADPHWSVRLAFKWCRNPEYVHVNTTPLFSLVRDSGAVLGLTLTSPVINRSQVKFYPVVGVVLVILLVVTMQLLLDFIPTGNVVAFYVCQMSVFTSLVFLLIAVIPYIAQLVKLKKD